jgi:hypothetical protein
MKHAKFVVDNKGRCNTGSSRVNCLECPMRKECHEMRARTYDGSNDAEYFSNKFEMARMYLSRELKKVMDGH